MPPSPFPHLPNLAQAESLMEKSGAGAPSLRAPRRVESYGISRKGGNPPGCRANKEVLASGSLRSGSRQASFCALVPRLRHEAVHLSQLSQLRNAWLVCPGVIGFCLRFIPMFTSDGHARGGEQYAQTPLPVRIAVCAGLPERRRGSTIPHHGHDRQQGDPEVPAVHLRAVVAEEK